MSRFRTALAIAAGVLLAACGDSSRPESGLGDGVIGDPALPDLEVLAGPPIREGEGGAAALRFELRLSRASAHPVQVRYQTRDGDARAGEDYRETAGSLSIPAGERRAYVVVPLIEDARPEHDERFDLLVTEASGSNLRGASAQGLIVDDDLVPDCREPAPGLFCAGAAEGALRVPVGVPLGGYLRPPLGGEYAPQLEDLAGGNPLPFFQSLLGFIPAISEGGGINVIPPNELRRSPYSTISPSSRGYYDSLMTKAIALSRDGKTLVLVKTDTVGMLDELVVGVAAEVKSRTGIDLGDGLIMSATHTHDGPGAIGNLSIKYFWAALDVYHPDLFVQIVHSVSDVVVQALANRVPARFGFTEGLEQGRGEDRYLNSFRRSREPYSEERVAEQTLLRRRIGVFRIDQVDAQGAPVRPLAVMVNYAAHGIMFDVENLYFSGDCLAGLERSVQARFETPVVTILIQAATGDVSPRADGDPTRQRIERFGELIAPQILDLWGKIDNYNRAPELRLLSQRVILSLDKLGYAPGEYPYPFGAVQCNALAPLPLCLPATPSGPEDLLDNGVAENDAFVPQDTHLGVAQIGDAVLILQPGEPLTEQGLRLLEASPFPREHSFIWGYSQDHVGYILPDLKADWDLGGTEGTTTFWGWKQGGLILDRTVALLNALKTHSEPPADEFQVNYFSLLPAVPPSALPSLAPGSVLVQPGSIARFGSNHLRFEGGDPVIDLPVVTLEEKVGESWQPMRRGDGRVLQPYYEFWLEYLMTNGRHGWNVRFEPAKDFPVGEYRFRVRGVAQQLPVQAPYEFSSESFTVSEADNLRVEDLRREGDWLSATLAYTPVPDNYRNIEPQGETDQPAPVRQGRVRFQSGSRVAVAGQPEIEEIEGRVYARYRVRLPAAGADSASGADRWGNRTPEASD